jgi:hypothetical protein
MNSFPIYGDIKKRFTSSGILNVHFWAHAVEENTFIKCMNKLENLEIFWENYSNLNSDDSPTIFEEGRDFVTGF